MDANELENEMNNDKIESAVNRLYRIVTGKVTQAQIASVAKDFGVDAGDLARAYRTALGHD